MSGARAFLYVQHLLGIGHLKRAATLARALATEGLEVTLASGGFPVAGIDSAGVRLLQLPAAGAADLSFRNLVDEHGVPVDEHWKRRRREALLAAWRDAAAHVLVLELFPFGRRQMRFELLPLLEEAHARSSAILCSVRDILGGQKSAERQQETLDLVERYFDHVLVHGDPAVASLDRSFAPAARIARRIAYTGYVVDPVAAGGGDAGSGEVIVSTGGGAVGAPLLRNAILARGLSALRDRTWRLLAGDNLGADDFAELARLAAEAGGDIVLERARRDFTTLLANCELSVSQAGYNTLMETLQAGARALVVPFAGGQETEQGERAACFARRRLVTVLPEHDLAPETLAAAIDRAARAPRPQPGAIDLEGAKRGAALIAGWARERVA